MRKLFTFILTALLLAIVGVGNVMAVDLRTGGTLYVKNYRPTGMGDNWKTNGGWIKVQVNGGALCEATLVAGAWDELTGIYSFTIPSGTWSNIILKRGSGETTWNSTGEIPLEEGKDFLREYSVNSPTGVWDSKEYALHTNWYLNVSDFKSSAYSSAGVELMKESSSATTASAKVSLSTGDNPYYKFYLNDVNANNGSSSSKFYKNSGSMTSLECTDWAFSTGDNDATIVPTIEGDYTFVVDISTPSAPIVSVVYPSYSTSLANLGGGFFATLRLPVEVSIPSGVTAYYESSYNLNTTTNVVSVGFSALTGYIPAGVPVILVGTSTGPYSFSHTSENKSAPGDLKSDFKGVYGETLLGNLGLSASEKAYVLQDYETGGQHHFGFHPLGSGDRPRVNASRCYLVIGTTGTLNAPAIHMWIEDENGATDLPFFVEGNVVSDNVIKFFENGNLFIQKNGVVYDMTGRVIR